MEKDTKNPNKTTAKNAARSWILIALIGVVVYSYYKINNKEEKFLEITQAELVSAIEEGRVKNSLERIVNRDDATTYLTGEILTDNKSEALAKADKSNKSDSANDD
jgi:hypothetical protein